MSVSEIKHFLLGKPLDPFKSETRKHIALITFFAWIGLGADGISSSCYGPEEAFLALGGHTQLAIFLAFVTGITVFLIAAAYLQVIELFPNGGGGYKVASTLLGPKAGLVSGSALIIDYVLTIAISIASAVDAVFSMLPHQLSMIELPIKIAAVLLLTYLNLRGLKESIKFLMPIFLGFMITHLILLGYGISVHFNGMDDILPNAINETTKTASTMGWVALLALFFKAFSLGGGTYTGLEAVSNSLHNLAEPKVKTGKMTMFCVAISLAVMAGGIIMLYLLWGVQHVEGETLNASVFKLITADWQIAGFSLSPVVVGVALALEAGLLFVAANTGFIAGPSVLATMAVDRWVPHFFTALSSRLVTKNGILLMGAAAIAALIVTHGDVRILVVLYSINVFLTFSLSLAGITRHRWINRHKKGELLKLYIPFLSFLLCVSILITTLFEKFLEGGWMTVCITSLSILGGYIVNRHYVTVKERVEQAEAELSYTFACEVRPNAETPTIDNTLPTAVFFVSELNASGMHSFMWVQKNFPDVFKNFVFVTVREIDNEEFVDEDKWSETQKNTKQLLRRYVAYCNCKGLPSAYYHSYGTDVLQKLTDLSDIIISDYPNAKFFSTKLTFDNESILSPILTPILHNQTAYMLQKRLHNKGIPLIVVPLKL
ncbi:MAG: APC family permease [Alphaproteobacteria bacterium]|nr:APC family permease [Alphaproteobacteria bacterium]